MKTIKIFLASSEELQNDRDAFGNLVRRLDKIYEKRGIRIELFEWEDYDAAYNSRRKQDEYNDAIRSSDMFLALFQTKAGRFTIEEFNVATEEFRKHSSPKIYTYCKDLQIGETESPELTAFKKHLFDEMGHYWCRYGNRDTMQLHFVMQLQLVESSNAERLEVDEGVVKYDGLPIATIDNLPFASDNPDYQKMRKEYLSLPEKIEKARIRVEKFPDDEDLQDDLQQKLDCYNKLKKEIEENQQALLNASKRIAQLQNQRISDRMRRAIDAFNNGRVNEAVIILDEAEEDAKRNLFEFKQSKELVELKRQAVVNSIEELKLKLSTLLADSSISADTREDSALSLFEQALEMASYIEYDEVKTIYLWYEYSKFLIRYSYYDKAYDTCSHLIDLLNKSSLSAGELMADSLNVMGTLNGESGDYEKALDCFKKSLSITKRLQDGRRLCQLYCNIGASHSKLGEFDRAIEYLQLALDADDEGELKASCYTNLSGAFYEIGSFEEALENSYKALSIYKTLHGDNDSTIADSYYNIGTIYKVNKNYEKSLEFYLKAQPIYIDSLGWIHRKTEQLLFYMAEVYSDIDDIENAISYYEKALVISKRLVEKKVSNYSLNKSSFGMPYISWLHNIIAGEYEKKNDYFSALKHYQDALSINIGLFGEQSNEVGVGEVGFGYRDLGLSYARLGNKKEALIYLNKALALFENAEWDVDIINEIEDEIAHLSI